MPKISSNQQTGIEVAGQYTRFNYDVHYFKAQNRSYNRDDPFFLAVPHKAEFRRPESKGVCIITHLGKKYEGFRGADEAEAVKKMKEYALATITAGTKTEPLIAIRKQNRQRFGRSSEDSTDKIIRFEFYKYDRITTGDEVIYKGDNVYHKHNLGRLSSHEINEFTFVPYTPELLEKCEQIAKRFDEIQKTIDKMFSSTDKAIETLSGQKVLEFPKGFSPWG